MLALHMTKLVAGDHHTFIMVSIAVVSLLDLLSNSAGYISAAAWLADFHAECTLAAAQRSKKLAQQADDLLYRFNLMSRTFGPSYCFLFTALQVLSILSLYNAISGEL